MNSLGSGTERRRRRIVAPPRERQRADARSGADDELEAALRRELRTDSQPPDEPTSTIEAWARQLGLQATALLTTDEAADVLRICERSVRQGVKDGWIPHVRMGRRLLIPVPLLLAMLLGERDPQG